MAGQIRGWRGGVKRETVDGRSEGEEVGGGEVEVNLALDILDPEFPVAAGLGQDQGGAVELEGCARVAGQGDGEGGAEAVGEAVHGGLGFKVLGQAGEEAEVGLRTGLEGEGQYSEEEHRSEGGEGGEALAGVAGHDGRVALAVGGRKGLGPLFTVDREAGRRDFKGLGVGVRWC